MKRISNPSLVVEHDVRSPDVVRRHVQHVHAAVLPRLPAQLVVVPRLFYPQIRRHYLILQVLKGIFIENSCHEEKMRRK